MYWNLTSSQKKRWHMYKKSQKNDMKAMTGTIRDKSG
ncbi:hypothetical protein [Cytobacillus firmus]